MLCRSTCFFSRGAHLRFSFFATTDITVTISYHGVSVDLVKHDLPAWLVFHRKVSGTPLSFKFAAYKPTVVCVSTLPIYRETV